MNWPGKSKRNEEPRGKDCVAVWPATTTEPELPPSGGLQPRNWKVLRAGSRGTANAREFPMREDGAEATSLVGFERPRWQLNCPATVLHEIIDCSRTPYPCYLIEIRW